MIQSNCMQVGIIPDTLVHPVCNIPTNEVYNIGTVLLHYLEEIGLNYEVLIVHGHLLDLTPNCLNHASVFALLNLLNNFKANLKVPCHEVWNFTPVIKTIGCVVNFLSF